MIFNERNDPNQISNLIDFNTREYKMASNFSSNYSEISDNGNNERSFDINRQDENNSLNDSQVSEYAVQRTFTENNDNRYSEYESQSSMFNLNFIKIDNKDSNLDFLKINHASNKQNEDMNVFGLNNNDTENNNIFNFDKSYSRKRNLMNEFDKYKEEENDQPQYIINDILGTNKSKNEDLYMNTNNSEVNNNFENMVYVDNNCNTEGSNINLDIKPKIFNDEYSKIPGKGSNKQIPKAINKALMGNKDNMDTNMSHSVNNSNNSKILKADPSVDDLIGKDIQLNFSEAICSS